MIVQFNHLLINQDVMAQVANSQLLSLLKTILSQNQFLSQYPSNLKIQNQNLKSQKKKKHQILVTKVRVSHQSMNMMKKPMIFLQKRSHNLSPIQRKSPPQIQMLIQNPRKNKMLLVRRRKLKSQRKRKKS